MAAAIRAVQARGAEHGFAQAEAGDVCRQRQAADQCGTGLAHRRAGLDAIAALGGDPEEVVGLAVKAAEKKGVDLADLTLSELQAFSTLIESDVVNALTIDGSLAARNHIGGTAPNQVKAAIERARKRLA